MNVARVLLRKAGFIVGIAVVLLACRGVAQFPPPFDPCRYSYKSMDLDGDLRTDLEWSLTICTWPVDPLPPDFLQTTTREERFTPFGGTQFWKSADSHRIPFGVLVGNGENRELQAVAGYEPLNAGSGQNWFAVTVPDAGGGRRHGWIQWPSPLGGPSRAEFARTTNQPMALGLPDAPRWLPWRNAGQEDLPSSNPDLNGGVLLSLQRNAAGFNFGVVALAAATDGTLFGIGMDRNDRFPPGSFGFRWSAQLFSVNPDGSRLRKLAPLGTNLTEQPDFGLTMTTQGRLFISQAMGPLRRFDPASGTLTTLRGFAGLRSPLHELSDGKLYSTTDSLLVVFDSKGEAARGLNLGNSGLRQFNAGLVEDAAGWIYLVAQSGGDGNAGGILRCRKDGTQSSVYIPFTALAGSATDHLPSRALLATLTKSPLCLAHDGSAYGTMQARYNNLVYRITSDGVPSVIHMNQWGSGPPWVFTNASGGMTWEGAFVRGMLGGLTEGGDGNLYGIAQPEYNGDDPYLPPAVMRIQLSGGGLETLSQDSQLQNWEYTGGSNFSQRAFPWVLGAEGILYAGTHQGIVSIFPGKNGVQPVCRTDAGRWLPSARGTLLRDEQGGYAAVVPTSGAFLEGFVASVKGDGTQGRILHSFSGGAGDVLKPSGALVWGDGGWIYGTSHQGDAHEFSPQLWRMRRDTGDLEVLVSLPGRDDGRPGLPYGLLRTRSGVILGTTPFGGAADQGTLYRYDPGENRITVLHEFGGSEADRWQPWPELLEGSDGWIYGLGTAENLGPGLPDGWFRIAADGSGYQVLRKLERTNGSALQISGGLTEASDHRFYCVRALPWPGPTNAPITGQVLRLTLPASGADSGRLEVVFENPADEEPHLSPVGRLLELPSGELVGVGRSEETAIYSVNPSSGAVRRVHRWGTRGTSRWLGISDRFASAVLESDGSLVVPVEGAILRVNLSVSTVPEAIPDVSLPGRYGESLPSLDSTRFFTSSSLFSGARDLPAGIDFVRPASNQPFGYIRGQFLETGTIHSEVYSSDGNWPETVVTNRITFEISPMPLKLKGPVATWVTGEPKPLPAGSAVGLIPGDSSLVGITWRLEDGAAGHPGIYPLVPEIRDPDGRLRYYELSVEEGRLTVVDRETRVVQDGGATYLEFPPLADHRFSVSEASSLKGPWNPFFSTQGSASVAQRLLLTPPADGREHYYRVEATY